MSSGTEICIVCAWRQSCQKKFSISGKNMRCADFVKDVSIRPDKNQAEGKNASSGQDDSRKE